MSGVTTLTPFYRGWEEYQRLLIDALAPLSPDQLALAVAPGQRPVWLIAAHIIGTRVGWFQRLGEGDAALAAFDPWDLDGAPARTAAELVTGLEATWGMISDCLDRWTPAMLDDRFSYPRPDGMVTRTRQWILWHVLEHDLHHGGEIALTLGTNGLPAPEL